mgnify:CR=1 FL=1
MLKIDSENYTEIFLQLAAAAFEKLELSGEAYAEVEFVTRAEIRSLNARSRGVDRETDVLSYPALDEIKPFTPENYPFEYDGNKNAVCIGSIVICGEVAEEQAAEYGHSQLREICYLFVHGLMHLFGYDHISEDDRAVMRQKEESVLSALNITREDAV